MNPYAVRYGGYPETRTVDQCDDFHGTKVADPYRWLEDQNSAEVADWVRPDPAYRLRDRAQAGIPYPPVLLMTSDHDDRVVPAHSFKFAARLQAVNPTGLCLVRVNYDAGHGRGKSRAMLLAERTDLLAFIAAHTGLALEVTSPIGS